MLALRLTRASHFEISTAARWLGADAWRSAFLIRRVLQRWAAERAIRLARQTPHEFRHLFERWRNKVVEAATRRQLAAARFQRYLLAYQQFFFAYNWPR